MAEDFESQQSETHIVATPSALVIALGKEHQAQMQRCLQESGEVKFTLKEVSTTKMFEAMAGAPIIID